MTKRVPQLGLEQRNQLFKLAEEVGLRVEDFRWGTETSEAACHEGKLLPVEQRMAGASCSSWYLSGFCKRHRRSPCGRPKVTVLSVPAVFAVRIYYR